MSWDKLTDEEKERYCSLKECMIDALSVKEVQLYERLIHELLDKVNERQK
ncbi:hypothetical protein [Priestia taiwanensis]|uniref:Uncharacterized protein n=1 Tax=Priestia taiwanensis TaxID=1347902 RepID=A0A917EL88_9BACI|nr:hypothetical protein [Priestia taiwanensis]MBM7361901.1 hypothetical protein [Priestia taiwanensis]GGE57848.1 hypothetical protein GCM10007140_05290 [Priestia taiwanensis]